MKLKYRRALVAAVLAGIAVSASAASLPPEADVFAGSGQACPAGTFESSPSYHWQNGHFVRDGWVCESLYKD
jgi:hypothetical protein